MFFGLFKSFGEFGTRVICSKIFVLILVSILIFVVIVIVGEMVGNICVYEDWVAVGD